VLINGTTVTVKVAHVRLCHSRMLFVRAYPRETQEMVFDAHNRAFAFFKGTCTRGIYDNMKTAVEAVFIGKDRQYNRRFLRMCGHYLVEPVACTPASGWEKGQVENQVGLVGSPALTPRLTDTTARPLAPHPRHRPRPYRKEIAYFSNPHTLTFRRIWVLPSSKMVLKSNRQPAASSILVHTELAGAKKSVPRRSMSQSWAPTREM